MGSGVVVQERVDRGNPSSTSIGIKVAQPVRQVHPRSKRKRPWLGSLSVLCGQDSHSLTDKQPELLSLSSNIQTGTGRRASCWDALVSVGAL